ncbi:hypothetical protein L0Y65_04400 [Candidatus Micrarchaeota archaeon]|nr:hypothetical protein [Candidatus Micrarchaeota archaeon]
MIRKRKGKANPAAGTAAVRGMQAKGRRNKGAAGYAQETEDAGREADAPITQYIFTFELIRQYPTVRSFIVKQPLKRSFKDTVDEFFGGNKKGVYRI